MYIKLNFTGNVEWKHIFNMVRLIIANNVLSVSDLTSLADYTSNNYIDSTTRSLLDVGTSEIFRTASPGVGYATTVPWSWNWQSTVGGTNFPGSTVGTYGSTLSYTGTNTTGPELIFERTISTYSPTSSTDKSGKYYVRLKYDGSTNLTLGTYRSITGASPFSVGVSSSSQGQASGQIANTYTLTNGSDQIIGYQMSLATSFFMFMNQYSVLIGGKGPTSSKTDQGWLMTTSRPFVTATTTTATTTLTSVTTLVADGSRISFSSLGNPSDTSVALGNYYYLRNTNQANTFSITNSLFNHHTANPIVRVASTGPGPTMNVDGYIPHGINANNNFAAHFGPAFVSEFTPYDSTAVVSNGYVPVMYNGGYTSIAAAGGTTGCQKGWYGMAAQDFLFGDAYTSSQSYKILSIQNPTPNASGTWSPTYNAGVYIGTDQRTLERAPLGDLNGAVINASISGTTLTIQSVSQGTVAVGQTLSGPGITGNMSISSGSALSWVISNPNSVSITSSTSIMCVAGNVTDRAITPVLWDQPAYKFPDASGNSSFGLFPLVWSNSSYNTAGGKLTPTLAGFMLFNGDYQPDDYFTYSGTNYALWPMADGFTRRLGIAVPKT